MGGDTATIRAFYAAFNASSVWPTPPATSFTCGCAGEMACFDNRRMLHGRSAFDPSSGRRWLRGCYSEREELESRLRMLDRADRMRLAGQGARPAA